NPLRPSVVRPLLPRSSSIVTIRSRGQPNATACSAKPYCRAVDSRCSRTCRGDDCRTYTIASRSRCAGSIFDEDDNESGTTLVVGAGAIGTDRDRSAVFIFHLLFSWRRNELPGDDLTQRQQTFLPGFVGQPFPQILQ